jgi:hypothetical protein
MGFHDEARKIAQQKEQNQLTEEQIRQRFVERMDRAVPEIREQRERRRSECIEKVLKWFDEIGMLPRPELTVEFTLRSTRDPYSDRDIEEPYFKITWEFEGYEYRASCASEGPEAWPFIEMRLGYRWFYANTKEQIGHAFLVYQAMGF